MGCTSSALVAHGSCFYETYVLGRKLGEGAYGQVRAARAKSGATVAVKIIDARKRTFVPGEAPKPDADAIDFALQEIKVWKAIGKHDHCVSFISAFFENNLFFLVMEKCACSLLDKMSSETSFTDGEMRNVFRGMLGGIDHLHSLKVVHRDIKPDNFLLGGPDRSTVKLGDFGMAARVSRDGSLRGVCGTVSYMSPEMLIRGVYGLSTDVWSMGATAYLMIHGNFPYAEGVRDAAGMKMAIIQGTPAISFTRKEEDPALFSDEFIERTTPFLKAMLQRDPQMRKTVPEILSLPFFCPDFHKELSVVSEVAAANDEGILAKAFRRARNATLEWQEVKEMHMAKSTLSHQQDLENLLKLLQEKHRSSDLCSHSFSEGIGLKVIEEIRSPSKETLLNAGHEERIHKRSGSRSRTHSGIMGGNAKVEKCDAGFRTSPGSDQTHRRGQSVIVPL